MGKKRKKDGRRKGARVNQNAKSTAVNKAITKKLAVALFDGSAVRLGNQKYLKPTTRRGPSCREYRCFKAWDFHDPVAEKRLEAWGSAHGSQNTTRLFHGTKFHNLGGISNKSLQCGHWGMFGGAIYLTPNISKALGYAGYDKETFYILEVKANLGKVLLCKEADHDLTKESVHTRGFHSVEGRQGYTASNLDPTLRNTEYAVYDPAQVVITAIFAYQKHVIGATKLPFA